MTTTIPQLKKLLAREIAASPFEIEIVKQDGGHRVTPGG